MDPRSLYSVVPSAYAAMSGQRPVLIHLLEGYVDAGGITHQIVDALLDSLDHEPLAEFDADTLHDYRARRPIMHYNDDHWTHAVMPGMVLHRVTDLAGTDFLLLEGDEPDSHWISAVEAILALSSDLGVRRVLTGSGMPLAVPHTRPVLMTTHASDQALRRPNPEAFSDVSLPGSFSNLLDLRAGERGIESMGFIAHVPHYLAQGTFAPAAERVTEALAEASGLVLPMDELRSASALTNEALVTEIADDPELGTLIERLESAYDERAQQHATVPSPDEIGALVERFLAERDSQRGDS